MAFFSEKKNILRLLVVVLWVLLIGTLLKRDYFVRSLDVRESEALQRGREESFAGIYFQDQRIGYVKNRLVEEGPDQYSLTQEAYMLLNIMDQSHPVDMQVQASLGKGLLLKGFVFHFTSPFYKMDAEGTVDGQVVNFTLTSGKETTSNSIRLEKPPFLSTSNRQYLLQQGLKPGDKIKIPYFDPFSLSGKDTVMEYQGLEKKLIKGRVFQLHHFVESFSGVKISSWLDDNGKVIKEESPAGFVFISEPEFAATDIEVKGNEILSSVSAPLTGTMPDLEGLTTIQYRLQLPEDVTFELDQDRQALAGNLLTVNLEELPGDDAVVCPGFESELASTPYIQSKNGVVANLAGSIGNETERPMPLVRKIAAWVYGNIEKRPVLGIPDALTTLSTRVGDCNEHAALFAALARNRGIPTRVVAGVMYFEGAFFYHAWNEVCIDDTWISVDTTKNQLPADLSHIKFVVGETSEQVRIGALLGKLAIEVEE